MLIGSKIKPRKNAPQQRTVSLFDTPYVFKNLAGDGHFVAEVKNQAHIETFLANDAFYAYDNAVPALRRAPAQAPAGNPEPSGDSTQASTGEESNETTAPAGTPGLGDYSPEVIAEANALVELTIAKLGPALGKVSNPVVVKAALLVEQAKGDDARSTVVKMLTDCIEAMKTANVTA